jgi:hypothetical protein
MTGIGQISNPGRSFCGAQACPKCGTRFDADSDVLVFLWLGMLLGVLLTLMLCR